MIGSITGRNDRRLGERGDWLAGTGSAHCWKPVTLRWRGRGRRRCFTTDRGRPALLGVLDDMRRAPWADGVVSGEALGQFGFAAEGGVVGAVNMARQPESNPNGVPGKRWVAAEPGKPVPIGSGQHGGWGPDETRPFLMVNDGRNVGVRRQPSSLVDIAPTLVGFLGLPAKGFDGACLTP